MYQRLSAEVPFVLATESVQLAWAGLVSTEFRKRELVAGSRWVITCYSVAAAGYSREKFGETA